MPAVRAIDQPFRRSPSPRRQRGVAAVEFAIIIFIMLLIGAGIVEFGRAFWYYDAVLKGTRDAARFLSVVPLASLPGAVAGAQDIVVRAATAGGVPVFATGNVSVFCAPIACNAAVLPANITSVTVGVNYDLGIGTLFPFIGPTSAENGTSFAVTLTPHTTMPYMW